MPWLSVAAGLLKLVNMIASYMKDRQLIEAGKAEAIVEGMQHVSAMLDDASKGAAGMRFDSEWSKKIREKYRRP